MTRKIDLHGQQKVRAGLFRVPMTDSHATLPAECIHWHRGQMAKSQADAHVTLMCADFRAGIRGLDTLGRCWNEVAEHTNIIGGGAYAYQQAAMYNKMRDELASAFLRSLKAGVNSQILNHRLVSPGCTASGHVRASDDILVQPLRDDLAPLVKNMEAYEEMLVKLRMK